MARSKSSTGIRRLSFSDPRGYSYGVVGIDRLVPDPGNPRIPVQESSLETILALVEDDKEGLYTLAKDIVKMAGNNPAELLSVTEVEGALVVKEGNRRLAARRLLRNPEILRGHLTDAEVNRWKKLGDDSRAKKLPADVLVVIGVDHEEWVDRRHLGLQDGAGLQPWNTRAKARRDAQRRGTKSRTEALLDGLKAIDATRFGDLEPPPRTYSTLERLLDSQDARAHIGIDVDDEGRLLLRRGQRSLSLLEEALKDLRAPKKERLTSRRIHSKEHIIDYLAGLDERIGHVKDTAPIKLSAGPRASSPAVQTEPKPPRRPADVLKSIRRSTKARPAKLYDELAKARKYEMPNAAIVLTRILLELTVNQYATLRGLTIGQDRDAEAEAEVAAFREAVGRAGIKMPKRINKGLDFLGSAPPSLNEKMNRVIDALVEDGKFDKKEAMAKKRDLSSKEIVPLLNDAVHRLLSVPSLDRTNHILEVVEPVLNAITS